LRGKKNYGNKNAQLSEIKISLGSFLRKKKKKNLKLSEMISDEPRRNSPKTAGVREIPAQVHAHGYWADIPEPGLLGRTQGTAILAKHIAFSGLRRSLAPT